MMNGSQALSTFRYFSHNRSHRYGFNGKEMDNEVKGSTGTQYDYGFRIYDPRICKFLSVDPLTKSYPYYTPYQFAGNNPIKFIDLDGLEEAPAPGGDANNNTNTKPESGKTTAAGVEDKAWGTMTIHSNVKPGAGMLAGHAWVELKKNDGTTTTLSLWGNQPKEGREFFANKEAGQTGIVSRTVPITESDVETINEFNSKPSNVDWKAGNTCAGYSCNLWNEVTGENLDAKNVLGAATPSTLSKSIVNKNEGSYTNTATANAPQGSSPSASANDSGVSSVSSSASSSLSGKSSLSGGSSGVTGQKKKADVNYSDTKIK